MSEGGGREMVSEGRGTSRSPGSRSVHSAWRCTPRGTMQCCSLPIWSRRWRTGQVEVVRARVAVLLCNVDTACSACGRNSRLMSLP